MLRESIAKVVGVAAVAVDVLLVVVLRVVALRVVVRVPRAAAVHPARAHRAHHPQVGFIRAIRRHAQSHEPARLMSTHAGICRHPTRHIVRIIMVHQRCTF